MEWFSSNRTRIAFIYVKLNPPKVRERFETPHGPSALPSSILPDRYVEISAMFQVQLFLQSSLMFGDWLQYLRNSSIWRLFSCFGLCRRRWYVYLTRWTHQKRQFSSYAWTPNFNSNKRWNFIGFSNYKWLQRMQAESI